MTMKATKKAARAPAAKPKPWAMPAMFAGQTVVCVGGGPSLNQSQLDAVQAAGFPVIAINDAYRLCPGAAILYAADLQWWEWEYQDNWQTINRFQGLKITTNDEAAIRWDLHHLRGERLGGYSLDPACLNYGPLR